jgi:quinol monooxygenase YgiN
MVAHVKTSVVIGACAVLLSASCGTAAQEPPPKFSSVTIEVKPGMNEQFEEVVRKFRDAAEQTNGPQRWLASQSMSGNPIYTINVPFATWAEFGPPPADGNPLVAAYGQEEANRILGLLREAEQSVTTTIYVARADLSRPAPESDATPVAVLYIDLNVRLGMEQQFEDYAKQVIEATNATEPNAYWQMRQRMFGPGNAAGYRVVVTFAQWADLDVEPKPIPQRMEEHFGAEEAARLATAGLATIQGINERLNRVRSDLARPPVDD